MVLAHRHARGPIDDDVRGLQDRVGEDSGVDVVRVLLRLFLELGHAPELAMRRDRGKRPGQFRVLGNGRLHEESRPRRIDATGQKIRGHIAHATLHLSGFEWLGDGMVVHYAKEAAVFVLQRDPVAHCPQIVSKVQFA